MKKLPRHLPFYYGWIIVAVSFVTLGLSFGVWYSFSVFFVAIIKDFGWNRSATASIFSLFIISHYLCAMVAGIMVDRYGPRWLIPAGALWLSIALFAVSRATTLPHFYLSYGIGAAAGVSFMGFVPHAALLPRWFIRRRGLAVGMAMSGIGLGMLLIPPGMEHIIASHGWRAAYRVLALLMLVAIPLNILLQRRDPRQVGTVPDGTRAPAPAGSPATRSKRMVVLDHDWADTSWDAGKALRTRRFWLLAAGFFFGPFAIQGTLLHAVACLIDNGIPSRQAAAVLGILGICGSGGKIILGFLADRWQRETANSIGMAAASLGIIALLAVQQQPQVFAYLFAAFFGLGYGAAAPLFPSIAADLFQGPTFGRIFGLLSLFLGLGGAAGAWAAGRVFDVTHSYEPAFLVIMTALWLSCLAFWLAAPRKVRRILPTGPLDQETG
ncbi:MAG: MFS transporter [Deltaproteobacteria bacterium]|nr:MFS transporter [Candidatus Anaeroferrophillus wilburensis]MBN2888556.1 MFS transporter [Deltaproteobacteria bacterium]